MHVWFYFYTIGSAKIISYLTVSVKRQSLATVYDLLDQNTFTFGLLGASNMVNKLKTSRNVLDNKLYEQIKHLECDYPEVLSTNSTRLFEKVLKENFVLIGSFFFYYEIMYMFPDHSCDLAMTDSWQGNTVALAMQNNSAYKRYVNEFTPDFAEFGIAQRLAAESFPNISCTRD